QARRRSISGGAANGFDAVAVGVMHEGAVIAWLVPGPHAWFMEHFGIDADRCPGRMPARQPCQLPRTRYASRGTPRRWSTGRSRTLASSIMLARARGGWACAWSTVSVMVLSSRLGGGTGSRPRRAHSRLGGAAALSGHG